MDPDFRPETLLALNAVKEALRLTRLGSGSEIASWKAERDIVTGTDLAVEDLLRARLGTLPYPVIGEERGGAAPADGSAYWLVDPICGTRNLASGIPLFSVNVALIEHGRVTVSVVGVPTGDTPIAELGRGAWMPDGDSWRPMACSADSRTVVIEEVKAEDERREFAAQLIAAVVRANQWDIRSLGSSVGLAYVALGGLSAYVAPVAAALHAAAGVGLVTEAGGLVSDLAGHPWTPGSDSVLAAATPELHAELLQLVRGAMTASGRRTSAS